MGNPQNQIHNACCLPMCVSYFVPLGPDPHVDTPSSLPIHIRRTPCPDIASSLPPHLLANQNQITHLSFQSSSYTPDYPPPTPSSSSPPFPASSSGSACPPAPARGPGRTAVRTPSGPGPDAAARCWCGWHVFDQRSGGHGRQSQSRSRWKWPKAAWVCCLRRTGRGGV